ncbi:MAG: non-canonical purine NTP pyrophosphatase [Candidatus Gracilibacteria bacterium]|nr:non-canonical purine NTP pyrophosphatase [Candidatus Gracilibacteria bacterium]
MVKLLIATGNPGKISMFKDMVKDISDIEFLFLSDFKDIPMSPSEDGATPEENALLKAKYYSEHYNIPALADDAGFEIDELGGEPGIMARRWGGLFPDTIKDDDWIDFYLNKTRNIGGEFLHASFPFSRCIYMPDGRYFFQSDKIRFLLSREPRFPFKEGWPISALRVFEDGRHEMDIPFDDPVWEEQLNTKGLFELLDNLR